MSDPLEGLPAAFRAELAALGIVARALAPLSPDRRARVILLAALTGAGRHLSDAQLRILVELAREPDAPAPAPESYGPGIPPPPRLYPRAVRTPAPPKPSTSTELAVLRLWAGQPIDPSEPPPPESTPPRRRDDE